MKASAVTHDDLLEWLRAPTGHAGDDRMQRCAADEIERLRAEVGRLKRRVARLKDGVGGEKSALLGDAAWAQNRGQY